MAIDPNIALRGQTLTQIMGPMELAQQGMTLKRLLQQNQANEQDFEAKRIAMQRDMEGQKYNKLKNETEASRMLAGSMNQQNIGATLQRAKELGLSGWENISEKMTPAQLKEFQFSQLSPEDRWKYQLRQDEMTNKRLDREAARQQRLHEQTIKNEEKNIPQNVHAAALYGKRLESANSQLENLYSNGYDPTSVGQSIINKISPEFAKGEQQKLAEQAQRNFINAVLRRESGATIQQPEFDSANKQYFPQVGDTAEVLAQKKLNREQAFAGLRAEGDKAWGKMESHIPREMASKPKVVHGTIEDGYVFLGGDPAEKKNWIKR